MKVYATIPQSPLAAAGRAAAAAERAGYDGIVTLENRHNPFLPLAVAATTTDRVELTTGIAIAFARTPMASANLAWDLNESSGGRFVLGLGPQVRAHNERRFGVPWSPPVPRLREYVDVLRAIWRCWRDGEPAAYQGEHYRFSLMTPNFIPPGAGLRLPPVALAAVGPAMLALAGEVADAVYLHPFCTRRYIEQVIGPALDRGLGRAGRNRDSLQVTGGGFIATGPDRATVDERLAWVRQRIGFYASTPAYWPVLETEGLADLGPRLRDLTRAGNWAALAGEIPDTLVDACTVVGTHAELGPRIAARFGGLIDGVFASASAELPPDWPPALIAEVQAIAPICRSLRAL